MKVREQKRGAPFEETIPGKVYRDKEGNLVLRVSTAGKHADTMVHVSGAFAGKCSGTCHGPFTPVDCELVVL